MASEETRKKIAATALQLFSTRGCRAVTMDDIASELHISKRTLYETYATKEDLLAECLMTAHAEIEERHRRIYQRVEEPLLVALYMIKVNALHNLGYRRLLDDAERYYPDIHDHYFKIHTGAFRQMIEKALRYADQRHFLRKEADIDIAADFICGLVQQHRMSEVDDRDAYARWLNEVCFTFMRGLLTVDTIITYEKEEGNYHGLMQELSQEV